ncbi:MAG: NAD(P)/FAD-dependent oxidoreductase [Paracoccaceae bacterium]
MRRLYEPDAYRPDWPPSYWRATAPPPPPSPPLEGAAKADAAIVGAGFAGLSAARELAAAGMDVVVLDAVQPGWGASGRNGGFCCLGGSKLSDAAIVAKVGEDGARAYRRFQIEAIDHVGEFLDSHAIPARQGPDGEAYLAQSPKAYDALLNEAEADAALYGDRPEILPKAALAERGLAGPGFHGALLVRLGFPLHPMIYVDALARLAAAEGVRIFGGSPVTGLSPAPGGWRLTTPSGSVTAKRVLVATNGYSSEDLPSWLGGRLLPAISSILVTRPLTENERQAQGFTSPLMSCDTRRLLHYFRHLPDGRFLFGMRGGTSASPESDAATRTRVRAHFDALFPAWAGAETEQAWGGFACLTSSLHPYAGPVPRAEGLFAALGCHGTGVGPMSYAGAQVGREMTGSDHRIPALLRLPPARFPFPAFRRLGLWLAYQGYARKDGPLPAAPQA